MLSVMQTVTAIVGIILIFPGIVAAVITADHFCHQLRELPHRPVVNFVSIN